MADQYTFEVSLFSGGEEESGFHTQNTTNEEVQRRYLVQRGSNLVLKGELVDVIHGTLRPDGPPASLIISSFKFLGSNSSHRFRFAKITWEFKDAESETSYDPEVLKLSFDGQFSMNERPVQQTSTSSGNASVQAGYAGANANVGGTWEQSRSIEKVDRITLFGTSIFSRNKNFGEPNGAMWIMTENKSQGNGIPDSVTTAVLLQRKLDRKFCGTIQIKVKAGIGYSMENLFGDKPKDDPVNFVPQHKPPSTMYDQHRQNLDKIDLDEISLVKFYTPIPTSTSPEYVFFPRKYRDNNILTNGQT